MDLISTSPAVQRLGWLLDGLNSEWLEDVDAISVLVPTFTLKVPAARFIEVMTERAKTLVPIQMVGIDVEPCQASARFRSRGGDLWVDRVNVELSPPHRMTT